VDAPLTSDEKGIYFSYTLLLVVMSLVKRAKQPPVITTLKEGEQHPGGIVGTVVRYGILAGMWYLFAPGIFAAVTSL